MANIKGFTHDPTHALPLDVITPSDISAWLSTLPTASAAWLSATVNFKTASLLLAPGEKGAIDRATLIQRDEDALTLFAQAASILPENLVVYCNAFPDTFALREGFIGWGLAQYRFEAFKTKASLSSRAQLVWHKTISSSFVQDTLEAVFFARDLITTPASHLGPLELCAAITDLLSPLGAKARCLTGEELLRDNYPAIHTVGRASVRPPCLLDITWGEPSHPKVAFVGKGVCFDSGGLDLKTSSNMYLMKKDMGGAAVMAALAFLLIKQKIPVQGRLLIGAVENSVSGNAYRVLDVIKMRNGTTIEVGNTDAEGRLVLADCLAEARAWAPDLIIDCATLTGAARIALGTDLPAVFSQPITLAQDLHVIGATTLDPVWPLPLHQPYKALLKSQVADFSSTSTSAYGGALVAALFLHHFVGEDIPWIHIDLMAWNTKNTPGKPEGGEAQTLRTLFEFTKARYPS